MNISEWSVQDFAKHYVDTIYSQPNAWGQYLSPIFGQSHSILYAMSKRFDPLDAANAVDSALREHRNGTHSTCP
jgi:hypothetical protein